MNSLNQKEYRTVMLAADDKDEAKKDKIRF